MVMNFKVGDKLVPTKDKIGLTYWGFKFAIVKGVSNKGYTLERHYLDENGNVNVYCSDGWSGQHMKLIEPRPLEDWI